MRSSMRVLAFLLSLIGIAGQAMAQTATQNVTFEVQAINQISISGAAPTLTVSTATAGSQPNSVTSAGITWAVTTNQDTRKITAALSADMPSGVTLSVNLAAPTNATGGTYVPLSAVAADVVTGISKRNESSLSLTYRLEATVAAGVVASNSRTVTFTITG